MISKAGQRRTVSGARNVLGLLLSLWVSLAIQPCAVAAVSEHSCPHCPTGIEAAPDSQHHHGHSQSHDAAGASAECDSMQAGCCEIDDGIVATRTDSPEFDDNVVAIPTAAPPPGAIDVPYAEPELAVPLPVPAGRSVPLHIVKCVYLI